MFDGYKAGAPLRSVEERDGLTVVYTRHGETADHYIERMCQLRPLPRGTGGHQRLYRNRPSFWAAGPRV